MSYPSRHGNFFPHAIHAHFSPPVGKQESEPAPAAEPGSVNDILYGTAAPAESKQPVTSAGLSKDINKKRAALAANRVKQYEERLAASFQPLPNAPKPAAGVPTEKAAAAAKPIIPQPHEPKPDFSSPPVDLTRFDKGQGLAEMPVLKPSTANVDV